MNDTILDSIDLTDLDSIKAIGKDGLVEIFSKFDATELNKAMDGVAKQLDIELIGFAKNNYTLDGFQAYYRLIKHMELPNHAVQWIKDILEINKTYYDGKLTFAFRGSWKSTTISVIFLTFYIGHHPDKTNLIISANSTSADNITSAVADIVENNPVFSSVFPNVKPYKERGWGEDGYWVKDASVENWSAKQAGVIDPSFMCCGIDSKQLIGKHPTGLLIMDDIHDENNSISELERRKVVTKVSDTILPMTVKEIDERTGKRKMITTVLMIGTPWNEDDAYHYIIGTGQFLVSSLPIIEAAEDGEEGAIYFDGSMPDGRQYPDMVGYWKINFTEMNNKDTVMADRANSGPAGFARMYLLDLTKSKTSGLRYYTYPSEYIEETRWPLFGGVDYATVIKKKLTEDPGRDKFSMAWGAKSPLNKLIVFDGIIEQCTQAQAEVQMKKPQSIYPNWQYSVIEGDGVGEQFWIGISNRNPGLRVQMKKTGGVPKARRQELELGVWLEKGMILISDADTPYLSALRKALEDFPDGNNDIRDGLYWLARACPEVLIDPDDSEGAPQANYYQNKHRADDRGKKFAAALGGAKHAYGRRN